MTGSLTAKEEKQLSDDISSTIEAARTLVETIQSINRRIEVLEREVKSLKEQEEEEKK
jgi:polyhydroxyalkanoate synthesis regulator phasin